MAGVFVSYSRESVDAVRSLAADVEALDHTVWFDHDLKGGKAWWDEILAQIRDCKIFLLALSPESLQSVACTREYGYAADLGKPILPVLIADGVSANLLPPKLSQLQFVDYRKQDRACGIALAKALGAMPPAATLPDPLPASPSVPLSYLGRITEQIESGAALDLKEQSALVSELRRGLRDPEEAADARSLLLRLRKRDDLFARIGDEIDELLEGATSARASAETKSIRKEPPAHAPKDEAPRVDPPARSDPSAFAPPPKPANIAAQAGSRIGRAVAGFFIGALAGLVVAGITNSDAVIMLPAALVGAVIGGMSKKASA
ncbi:MAG TPA: toll/interleukin-1 receptor domain-containing protein [Dongiaceae bacterium]|nr:toll/interleukin-1 receptor domain-containing protein [Dongiaceae bacterium]